MKKILSFLIVLSMIGAVSVTALAAPDTDSVREILLKLEITRESNSENMTRYEFIESLLNVVSVSHKADKGENPYTDITSDMGEIYDVFCCAYRLGITSGGVARPNADITLNEAVKATLCALGYGIYAHYNGGFPVGYIKTAFEIKLLQGIDESIDRLNRTAAHRLLYNALNVDLMELVTIGNEPEYKSVPGVTALLKYLKIIKREGVLYGCADVNMLKNMHLGSDEVVIDEKVYKCENLNVSSLVGSKMEYYIDSEERVVAAAPDRTDIFIINASDVVSFKNSSLYVSNKKGKEVKYKFSVNTRVIISGEPAENFSESDFLGKSGEIRIVDINRDNIADSVFVTAYSVCVVKSVDVSKGMVYDKYNPLNNVCLDKSKLDSLSFTDETGNEMNLKELSEGDVITYFRSKNGKNITAYYSNSEVIGTVSEIAKSTDGIYKLTVNDKEYTATREFSENEVIKPQLCGAFRLTKDGRIASVSEEDSSMFFGYLVDGKENKGIGAGYSLKLFGEDNKMHTVLLANKLEVDGDLIDNNAAYKSFFENNKFTQKLVRYKLNEKGEVSCIDTDNKGTAESEDTLDNYYSCFKDSEGNPRSLKQTWRDVGMFGGRLPVSASTKVFIVPISEDADDEDYIIGSISYFKHDYSYAFDAYKTKKDGIEAEALVYKSDSESNEVPNDLAISVVDRITETLDTNGDIRRKMYVWSDGVLKEYFLKDIDVLKNVKSLKNTDAAYTPMCGDAVKLAVNDAGFITAIELLYQRNADVFKYPTGENTSSLLDTFRVAYGEIYAVSAGNIQFHRGVIQSADKEYFIDELECYKSSRMTIYTCEKINGDLSVRIGTISDMTDYKTTGKGTKAVVYCRSGQRGVIVLYNTEN